MMKRFLYIGLGNDGARWQSTRHNLGIETLRAWVEEKRNDATWEVTQWQKQEEYPAYSLLITHYSLRIECLFPTMMNESGRAVAACLKKTGLSVDDIVVIHDDVELPLGEVRLTRGGSAKGHNGVRSLQEALGTQEFTRLRLGVGRPLEGIALSDFVLEKFLPDEQENVTRMKQQALEELTSVSSQDH